MNWHKRAQEIFANWRDNGKRSVRRIAAATGIAKSSVHRHQRAMERRNQHPESGLWEVESGQQWLRLLVWAVIYVFGIKQGIGNETLSEFFHLLRLERHIGVSPTALQRLRVQMEQQILTYRDEQQQQLQQTNTKVEICAGADETFFEQAVLVLLDLASGYIFVESPASDRGYDTWNERVQQALGQTVEVKYLVSDRAKALVKLALAGLSCCSIADLFHALRGLGKQIGCHLGRQLAQLEKQRDQADAKLKKLHCEGKPRLVQQRKLIELQAQYSLVESTQATYHQLLQQLSLCVHPFAIDGSGFISATEVITALQQHIQTLSALLNTKQVPNFQTALDKFTQQIPALAAVVNTWWTWVLHSLSPYKLNFQTSNWLLTCLLPLVYWQQQVDRTKSPSLKHAYQSAYAQALRAYHQDPFTSTLSAESLQQWWGWAEWMVTKFQRTSSPVEGRNGYLSRLHHTGRGLSANRLQVLTVIHNFALKRTDGSTAARRLFGRQFPDLFEYIVDHMGELPIPRKARKTTKSKVPNLPAVPA